MASEWGFRPRTLRAANLPPGLKIDMLLAFEIDNDVRRKDPVCVNVFPYLLESAFLHHPLIRVDICGFALCSMRNVGDLQQVFGRYGSLFTGLYAAPTITGTVTGVDGAPFQGAFVEAQNAKTKITAIASSDRGGRYRIPNLPAGDYRVQIRAVGYRADPRTPVTLATDQNASLDFALQKGVVRWSDISQNQAAQLWPAAKGKDLLFAHCNICHQFQSRIASTRRDLDGWKDRVAFMRDAMRFSIFLGPNFSDQDAEEVANYLTSFSARIGCYRNRRRTCQAIRKPSDPPAATL